MERHVTRSVTTKIVITHEYTGKQLLDILFPKRDPKATYDITAGNEYSDSADLDCGDRLFVKETKVIYEDYDDEE